MREFSKVVLSAIGMFLHKMAVSVTKQASRLIREIAAVVLKVISAEKPYGTALFDQLSRLVPQRFCECVLLRTNAEGKMEVFLVRRLDNDTAYPGMYHCPGSAIRRGEQFEDVAERVAKREFKAEIDSIVVLRQAEFYFMESRGWGCSTPVVVFTKTPPQEGHWFPIGSLPEKTIDFHRERIIAAGVAYMQNRALYEAGLFLQRVALGEEPRDEFGYAVNADAARAAIAAALSLKDPMSPMGTVMYDAFTPHGTNVAVEGVCLRWNGDVLEVRLPPRPANDKFYAGQVAGLGQGVRRSDAGLGSALERLTNREFKCPTHYEFVGDVYITDDPRGWYECKIYIATPNVMPDDHWYPVDDMSSHTVRSHREQIVPKAAEFFRKLPRK